MVWITILNDFLVLRIIPNMIEATRKMLSRFLTLMRFPNNISPPLFPRHV